VEVSIQFHAPVSLTPPKNIPKYTEEELECLAEHVGKH